MSSLFPGTRRAGKENISSAHGLLEQAGYIRSVSSGIFNLIPLGWRVHKRITDLVYEIMEQNGVQNIQMPLLQPEEMWEKSGRLAKDEQYKTMFRVTDRQADKRYVLSPTAEEVVTSLVASEVNSWRDLPLVLHQIASKFRAEIRPHSGLLRCREFVMSDAYSFDKSEEEMVTTSDLFKSIYDQIFDLVNVGPVIPVQADNGEIGGSGSVELMLSCSIGEDTLLICDCCGFGANIEYFKEANTKAGDHCTRCADGHFLDSKGMELAHVFMLQNEYTQRFGATYQNEQNVAKPIWMGCYGLGTTRLMQAIVEKNRDAEGICWPKSVAPYQAQLIPINAEPAFTSNVFSALQEIDVIVDDRDISNGVKFKDADLMGMPWRIVIGKQSGAGLLEITNRRTKETQHMSIEAAVQQLSI